jgi:TusA-related sulfurtransferase
MTVLDLRSIRCPLALVTLKVTLKHELLLTTDTNNRSLKLLFSTESAMSDIVLYLDKKAYQYQLLTEKHQFSLLVFITNNH